MTETRQVRTIAVVVGALFWISNLATLIGGVITGTIPDAAGALTGFYPHAGSVVAGTLIDHVNDVAIVGYAVALYPVLRRFGQGAALGYAAFKVVEGVLLLVSAAMLLSLIPLSQSYLGGSAGGASALRAVAAVTLSQQFWTARLATLAYLVATPILNVLLYRSRLVPRFIPVWGLVALVMLAAGIALGVGNPTSGLQPGQLLVVPIILWELLFATWLIVRGFNPAARDGEPAPSPAQPLAPVSD
ncbi:MAG: DUF4386 domain-containing protein [Candidatus Dormibacteraeota bacterium]|nr:DUF4386 domain-containing protein [Candidatus Dormibacteraeota bacterium]